MSLKKIVILLVVITALLGVGFYSYYYQVSRERRKTTLMEQSRNLLRADKVNEAIPAYEELLREPRIRENERREAVGNLALSLFLTQDIERQKKAVGLVKKEIANEQNSQLQRAYFVILLNTFLVQAPNREFRYSVIWDDEPYRVFGEPAFEFKVAQRKLFEYADSIAPTAIGELQVGYWYATQFMINNTLTPAQKEEYAARVRKHIATGSALIGRDALNLPLDKTFHARTLLAATRGISAIHKLGVPGENDAENDFKALIATMERAAGQPLQNPALYDSLLLTRFHYASYLARVHGKERSEEISQVMQPIMASPLKRNFYVYLREKAKIPESAPATGYPSHRELYLIANIVPEFSDYWRSLATH